MNGLTRVRDEDLDSPTSKRSSRAATPHETHYDIYALPSLDSPTSSPPPSFFKSASFVVVNRASGLTSGLGIRYGLSSPDGGRSLSPVRDPGFFLAREPSYDATQAILLGWVEEEQLLFFDAIIESVPAPSVGSGGEVREWLIDVARRLEMEGIVSNGDIMLADVLEWREG